MYKVFFRYGRYGELNEFVQALSLLFLTPTSNIIAERFGLVLISSRKKIEKLSLNELLNLTICGIRDVPTMTIVEFKNPFTTDKQFIESFEDYYLGTVREKVTKAELVRLARLQSELKNNRSIRRELNSNFSNRQAYFNTAGLDNQDCKEFEELYKLSVKPVNDWLKSKEDAKRNEIAPLTKFIVRGF